MTKEDRYSVQITLQNPDTEEIISRMETVRFISKRKAISCANKTFKTLVRAFNPKDEHSYSNEMINVEVYDLDNEDEVVYTITN